MAMVTVKVIVMDLVQQNSAEQNGVSYAAAFLIKVVMFGIQGLAAAQTL